MEEGMSAAERQELALHEAKKKCSCLVKVVTVAFRLNDVPIMKPLCGFCSICWLPLLLQGETTMRQLQTRDGLPLHTVKKLPLILSHS